MTKMNDKGQSLVEAVIALGVAAIVVSAMAIGAVTAVNNSDFSKYQNLATQYAQEGIEIVRQQSQTDWATFKNYVGNEPTGDTWCLDQGSTAFVSRPTGCGQNINDQNGKPFFVREVMLTQTVPIYIAPGDVNTLNPACNGIVKAAVSVAWTDGKCSSSSDYCHMVTLYSCFADLNSPGQ
jgi:type II secretory pathway pseudopilin PulG